MPTARLNRWLSLLLAASVGMLVGAVFGGWASTRLPASAGAFSILGDAADRWESLEFVPAELPVPCPPGAPVIVVAGQSNAANSVGQRFAARRNVFQFYRGNCYPAAGPLAGAEGALGSYWPLVGDLLVERGFAPSVIFMGLAKGGTRAAQWADPADLGGYAMRHLKGVKATHVAWHQGESDAETPVEQYRASLQRVVGNFQAAAPGAPFIIARASVCGHHNGTRDSAPITRVQSELVDPARGVFAGPDTDALRSLEDRYDECHFSGVAAVKVARLWADAIAGATR